MITEAIYPNRFYHIANLRRMGARIRKENAIAIIDGVSKLRRAQVLASDGHACAALILAGLAARDSTKVEHVRQADRQYPGLEQKLRLLGALIERVEE